ncbi:ABC transporter permease [Rhodophyticola sp. CCM32]|uniref:ABC transporter permease n=1 Tax=Rhodophyticola sp. CCM32 TaxID=2916397 RepID=UPI003FD4718D
MRHPLLSFVISRGGSGLISLLLVSVLVFIGTALLPGDAAQSILGQNATPEALSELRAELGLNDPLPLRYWNWLAGMLQGDMGISFSSNRPVAEVLLPRLTHSMILALSAAIIALPLAISLGILAALKRESLLDRVISFVSMWLVSIPAFLTGYILINVFSTRLGWFPSLSVIRSGASLGDWAYVLALPVATLVFVTIAHTMRLTRTAILSVMASDYILMAEIKGLSPRYIILKHALPNALSPILSISMLTIAYLMVGIVVIEAVFSYAGMGKLMVDAVAYRDLPLVQACGVCFSFVFIFLNFLADFLSVLVNPRLREPKS